MHNVNILYLIIDVPTLRQVMQITRMTRLYTASRREDGRRRTPVTSSAETVSLCGLIALFGDGGCIFMPGSSAPWARREILKREGTKYSSSRRRYYYTLLAVKKKIRGQWQACSYVSMRGLCSAVPSRALIIRTSSGKSRHTRLCFGANCIVCVYSSLSFHSFHARVSIRRFYL